MRKSEAFPSRYLGKDDLKPLPGESMRVTVSDLRKETMTNQTGDEEVNVMLFVENGVKPWIFNPTNWNTVERVCGGESNAWKGTVIEIYIDWGVRFRGIEGGLRCRVISPPPGMVGAPGVPPGAVAPSTNLSWQDAQDYGETRGLSKNDLVLYLKTNGRENYNADRDSALIRDFIRQHSGQLVEEPTNEFGDDIPF